MNLPGYQFLSAPLWLVTALHILTLTLHFAAMNFLVGGAILVLWGRFSNRWENPAVRNCVKLFSTAMAATVTLGVAPLLFLQLVYPQQVYSSAIVMGWFWLAIVPAVILAYYLFYGAAFATQKKRGRLGLRIAAALAGLLYVSLVYSSVFSMAERPELIQRLYEQNQSGLIWNPEAGDYLLRWLHMILGAVSVGGFFVGLLGRDDDEAYRAGRGFFLWGMVLASAAGLAYLLTLAEDLVAFMRTPGIWTLTAAIVLSAGSLHFFFKKRFVASGFMLLVSLAGMVLARHYLRQVKLAGIFNPADLTVRPEWGLFLIFFLCFLAAVATVAWMLRLYFSPPPAPPAA